MADSLETKLNALLKLYQDLLERVKKLEIKNDELEEKIASLNIENGAMKMRLERLANNFNITPSEISTASNEIQPARSENFSVQAETNSNKTAPNPVYTPRTSNAPKEIKPAHFEKFSAQIETSPPSNSHITLRKKENPAPQNSPRRLQKTANTINTPQNFSTGEDFLRDYNIWQSKTDGFEKINARKDFIAKYKVRYFNCVNYNERMNQPKLPPIFEESPASGDYWAIQTAGNIFKVVPNVKSYNDNYHVARAMCEVFDSNFDAGNYSNIQLERAAEFTNSGQNWTLIRKGKLVLR